MGLGPGSWVLGSGYGAGVGVGVGVGGEERGFGFSGKTEKLFRETKGKERHSLSLWVLCRDVIGWARLFECTCCFYEVGDL